MALKVQVKFTDWGSNNLQEVSAKRIEQVQLGDLQSSANSSSIALRPTKHRAGPAEPRLQRQGACTTYYETTRNIWVMRVMGTISRSLTLKFHEMFISRSKSANFCQPRYNFPSFEPAPVVLTSHTWHLETSQSAKKPTKEGNNSVYRPYYEASTETPNNEPWL